MLKEAILFIIGCSILVANAVLSFLPFLSIRLSLPRGVEYVEGILSVLSCTLFLVGSCFAFLESVNAKGAGESSGKLGNPLYSESTEAILEKGIATPTTPDEFVVHYPSNHATLIQHLRQVAIDREHEEASESRARASKNLSMPSWRAVSAAHGLRPGRLCEIGLIASAIFLSSSILYWSTSVAALVTVIHHDVIDQWIRFPQLVAAFGFIIASAMLMIKTQKRWWQPAVRHLGWHINFWNLVGSAGFMFCAAFGLLDYVYWANFSFGCSYLWGKLTVLLLQRR